ncbi:ABC transporter ATP-binding protein [Candidatus Bathyarchaeota archaeon]|nr:MAG: oligopeptide ABC transporter ATP-binding protein [Crenarchaeota archaeon 13_1_40CM_3_53_5]TMI28370.1 MAG: ABC transporter ATP-binding protein [Candidatus Bathyarchaeota archaeon]TMI30660.1 MAG: ABC transporter ATP-binding protein [Candidatus Bathyarchaeota archaeon]
MEEPGVIVAEGLKKYFSLKRGFFETLVSKKDLFVKAVDDISFFVKKGEVLGLVGESGSGKTTTGRLLLRLADPTAGKILYRGKDISHLSARELKPLRREMQIIFQDPFESLDPRMLIKEIVAEPLRIQRVAKNEQELTERVKQILREVELVPPEEFMLRFPHELSGGQRQRVAVARAFVLDPQFVVADEPVSMLDVSIRAEILNLMLTLVQRRGASFLYITHDLALARHMCDRIAVMYLGKIVELGETGLIINQPLHPYTKALIAAVPVPDPTHRRIGDVISGEIPSPVNPPPGCTFHTRCPFAHSRCVNEVPPLIEVEKDHWVSCHLVDRPLTS